MSENAPDLAADIAARTDAYFNRTREVIGRFGDKRVTYAVFLRRPVVSAPALMLDWLRRVAQAVDVIEADALLPVELPLAAIGTEVRILASGIGDLTAAEAALVAQAPLGHLPAAKVQRRREDCESRFHRHLKFAGEQLGAPLQRFVAEEGSGQRVAGQRLLAVAEDLSAARFVSKATSCF